MDAAGWGITLAIAGLVLMYPVAIIANATTPLVLRGAANLTRRKLEGRVRFLESKLAEDSNWVMTPAELAQYKFTGQLFKLLFISAQTALAAGLFILSEYQRSTHTFSVDSFYSIAGLLVIFLGGNMVQFYSNRREWIGVYWYHSVECRKTIQKQIDGLKATLNP